MLIDTHCHLDDDRFADDLPSVVERARSAGLHAAVTIGIDAKTSRSSLQLADRFPLLYAAVGIQPNHVAEMEDQDWDRIVEWAAHPRVVAIGETGLDRYWDRAPFDQQEIWFRRHLELSRNARKPVIIHNRDAGADVVRVLRDEFSARGPVPGIMHSFTADRAVAEACVELGMHLSFAGMVTYKNADDLRAIVPLVPAHRLLVETDSPYLAPVPVRGKRNEPAYVAHTAELLARLRGVTVAELAEQTTRNACQLLGIPPVHAGAA